jgi:hypothetical protein
MHRSANTVSVSLAVLVLLVGGPAYAERVSVCHYSPDDPVEYHTIVVNDRAVDAHLAHGDLLGTCDDYEVANCFDGLDNDNDMWFDEDDADCSPMPDGGVECPCIGFSGTAAEAPWESWSDVGEFCHWWYDWAGYCSTYLWTPDDGTDIVQSIHTKLQIFGCQSTVFDGPWDPWGNDSGAVVFDESVIFSDDDIPSEYQWRACAEEMNEITACSLWPQPDWY